MKTYWTLVAVTIALVACASRTLPDQTERTKPFEGETVRKTTEEWQAQLTDAEYQVLRGHGTERAFTGEFWDHKEKGTYICGGCGLPLFHSDTKFKSGTGWPSYFRPIDASHVGETLDNSYGMSRIEVHCNRCDGHLGHVFHDGPQPTGLRYCINSASLDFEPDTEP